MDDLRGLSRTVAAKKKMHVRNAPKTHNGTLVCVHTTIPKHAMVAVSLVIAAATAQGWVRCGSRGNIEVLRMLSRLRKSITTRSRPMPPPPCGLAPYEKEVT